MLIARSVTLAVIVGLMLWQQSALATQRGQFGVLGAMGLIDALALGLVTAAGGLPRAEYAAVASALFGVLTILLAWRVLGEKVSARQWAGIAAVFAGIGMLSLQG